MIEFADKAVVITSIGGTTARDLGRFWDTFFPTQARYPAGWILESPPIVMSSWFTEADRATALVTVMIGESDWTAVCKKKNGSWTLLAYGRINY